MIEVGNLDTYLAGYFSLAEVGSLLGKITDPLVIIIRVVGLMVGYDFSMFFRVYT